MLNELFIIHCADSTLIMNPFTTKELARLGADFTGIDVKNSHITHSKSKTHHKYLTRQKGSLLLSIQMGNNSDDQMTITGAALLPNLHSPFLENSKYITLSDAGQHPVG